MRLSDHFKTRGNQIRLARKLDCAQSHLSKIAKRKAKASVTFALEIERGTEGEVSAEEVPMTKRSRAALRQLRKSGIFAPARKSA